MGNINFVLTREQAQDICNYYGEDMTSLEDWQICELLDKLIDDTIFGN